MSILDYSSVDWQSIVKYSEESPSGLVWNVNRGRVFVGDIAGSRAYTIKMKPKCWDLRFSGKLWKVHRIIWILLEQNLQSDDEINHKDVNPFNNRIDNLECVNHTLNMRRCSSHVGKELQVNNLTGINGVSEHRIEGLLTGYVASNRNLNGEMCSFYFGIDRYGKDLALKLAETTREFNIDHLNKMGAGYG